MSSKKLYPSQRKLKSLLSYDPETGIFTWNSDRNPRVSSGDIAGCITRSGVYIKIDDKNFAAHRLAYLYMEGKLPDPGHNIDHVNGNNKNNWYSNIRSVTFSQNSCNRSTQRNNKLGTKNVSLHKRSGKYRVSIASNKHRVYIGLFDDFELASLVAEEARSLYHKGYVRS